MTQPTRTEKVSFELTLKDEEIQKYKPDINILTNNSFNNKFEKLNIKYNINIEYIEDCNKKIESILNLCREGIYIHCTELIHNESIIIELGKNIERLSKLIKKQ